MSLRAGSATNASRSLARSLGRAERKATRARQAKQAKQTNQYIKQRKQNLPKHEKQIKQSNDSNQRKLNSIPDQIWSDLWPISSGFWADLELILKITDCPSQIKALTMTVASRHSTLSVHLLIRFYGRALLGSLWAARALPGHILATLKTHAFSEGFKSV